jgi:hypothetical protein
MRRLHHSSARFCDDTRGHVYVIRFPNTNGFVILDLARESSTR